MTLSTPSPLTITTRLAVESDANAILRIYQEGIDTGNATFTASAPSWQEWCDGHLDICRIVALEDDVVVGWAALSGVSSRCVYGGVAEVSVYVSTAKTGRGIGSVLLDELIKASEENGVWMLQAGIFPENEASILAHKKHGFRLVGVRKGLGKMTHGPQAGKWRDVALLERRSTIAGTD